MRLEAHATTSDSATALDAALTELEDRGLVGWDRRGNRYDLHPIVRGVVWNSLNTEQRQSVCQTLQTHFQPIEVPGWKNVTSIADLAPAIELFHALIELGRYDDAFTVFRDRLEKATLWRLSASRLRIELVERLFPDGTDQLPRLSTPRVQSYSLNALAQAYQLNGQPGSAVPLLRRKCDLNEQANDAASRRAGLCNLSYAERLAGAVRSAEASARLALRLSRDLGNAFQEAMSLSLLGLALAVRGVVSEASRALALSLEHWVEDHDQQGVSLVCAYQAEVALWSGAAATAWTLADRAWEMAAVDKFEADFIRAARLQGTAALRSLECSGSTEHSDVSGTSAPNSPALSSPKTTSSGPHRIPAKAASGDQAHAGDQSCAAENGGLRQAGALQGATIEFAHERLHLALTRARACDHVQEELPTLIALAELHETLARQEAQESRLRFHRDPLRNVRPIQRPALAVTTDRTVPSSPNTASASRPETQSTATGQDDVVWDENSTVKNSRDGNRSLLNGTPSRSESRWNRNLHSRGGASERVTDGDETSPPSATLGSPLPQRETETLATSLRLTPAEHLVQAERLLDDVWDRCERGPYPLFHADALNRLASIQRLRATFLTPNSAEHRAALAQAGEAAINAYQKAWCDGPPYAYAYGLTQAEQHLTALGLPCPDMPPFGASKFPPMPDVPIEPEST